MTRRLLQALVVVLTVGTAWVVKPAPAQPGIDLGVEPAPPAYAACVAAVERDLASELYVGSVVRGDALVTLVAPREERSEVLGVGAAGGARLDLSEVGVAGVAGLLVEMPTADAAGAVLATRDEAAAAGSCTRPSTGTLLALGGSTATGETLDLVLTNPYAADAIVSVGSSSESGEDSASELASILVPAQTTVVRRLEPLLALRQSLSVRMEVQRGAIHAALVQTSDGDVAISEAVEPSQDWWLPALDVPDSSLRLVIATDSPLPVDVVVDSYIRGELSESAFSGTIQPRSQVDIALADLMEGPGGLRVSSDGPVVAALVVNGAGTRAIAPATTLSSEWVLPGSGVLGNSRAWVFNPGEVDAELVLQPLVPDVPARATTVPADTAVSVALENVAGGYLIRSSSEVSVLWSARQGGLSLGAGHPLVLFTE